jgi:hypothetical protein
MEKRITTLEVRMDQTAAAIDRLDRSINGLRGDMDKKFLHIEDKFDRKFCWIIGLQITSLLAVMVYLGKATQQF